MSLQRLKDAAEKAKKELSSTLNTNVNLPFITATAEGPKHLNMDITRAKFEELTAFLVEKTMEPTRKALADSGLSISEVDKVILVGGSTRIPAVQEAIKKFTGKEPHKGINPDECVAIGAAIQAGVLAGDVKDVLLLDVTPLSLGIETLGGVFTKIIERNTTIPTKKSQVFSTAADNQTQVEIHVLQGERPMAQDNKSLGRFILDGIPPAPRGVPQVEVTFDLDSSGILSVSAKDRASGKEQSIKITGSTGLTKEEVEKMTQEAEAHADEDSKKKEFVEVKNQADALIFTTEKTIKDLGDKIKDFDKKELEDRVSELKKTLESDDKEEIKKKTEELSDKLQKVGAAAYEKAEPQPEENTKTESSEGEQKKDTEEPVEGEVVND